MTKGCIKDLNIDYNAKRLWISAKDVAYGQVTGTSTVLSGGFGSGDPTLSELGTSGLGAIKLEGVTDEVDVLWVPNDVDIKHPVGIRHLWTSGYATANGTATFTTLYKLFIEGEALAIAATALTKAHTASTKVSATALTLYWSPVGILGPNIITPTTLAVAFDIKASAVTGIAIATDFVYWVGCELIYTPRYTSGGGSTRSALWKYYPNALHEAAADLDIAI